MFECHITNGLSHAGLAVRHFGYSLLEKPKRIATAGMVRRSETQDKEVVNYYLPFGTSEFNYKGNTFKFEIIKDGNITEETAARHCYPCHITVFINGEEEKDYQSIWQEFLEEAGKYYKEQIREINNEPDKVSVHIFDEYWDVLNKRARRKIETIHLDGEENKILEYIRSFLKPETKEFYEELGIPYKLNILFEGLPGTGKTSLIYTIASELNRDIAILNFNKDVDDNVFMRALRRLPKKALFVLEDVDVLFKERKENDNQKSMISFSGLLNSLDGMAFKDDLITIMTTNYECNLDIALKRPGRIDTQVHFGFAKESQVNSMYKKFFKENTKGEYKDFYKQIKGLNFTTAMIQQYFMWHMFKPKELIENIAEFKDICSKHNYDKKLDLYM
jgi:SpoVK/Ycf46/Vps4 family AAA+-type ATPase